MSQSFDTVDVLRLEVETDPTGLTNLVQNPNGELGGWGWVTPVSGSAMAGLDGDLEYTSPGLVASYFYSENMPIAAGEYAAASWFADGGTAGYYHRVKFEWLNSSGTLLSSSAQTGYLAVTSFSTNYYGPYQAPASTAYVRIRFDVYSNNSGGNPAAGSKVYFNQVTVAKAATSGELGTLRTNLFKNPSSEVATPFELASWAGGSTPLVNRSSNFAYVGSWSTHMQANAFGTNSEMEMRTISPGTGYITGLVAGRDYTFQFRARAGTTGRTVKAWLFWQDASGSNLGLGNVTVTGTDVAGAWTQFTATGTCPAGAVQADLNVRVTSYPATMPANESHYFDAFMVEESSSVGDYFDGATTDAGGWDYGWTGTAHDSTSTAGLADLSYIEPVTYLNILQECKEIRINRSALDVGTLSAEVRSTALDPSVSDLIRPGRKCRLVRVSDASPIFTGKILNASVKYELKDPAVPESKRARVSLTAVDNVAVLAQQKRTDGVASIDDLPYVLEGCGVPWNVNGSGDQVASATVSAVNENASALDQIAVTRDSNLGYVWVDRFGVLHAWDIASDAYGAAVALADPDVSDVDLSFNTADLINEVWVKYLRFNATTQETEEVPYGPYRDETSISEWGVRSAEFTVQGISEGSVSTYAASILTANATPEVTLNSAVIPIMNTTDVDTWASLDLYQPVDPGLTAYNPTAVELAPTSIEHTITPEKWLVTIGFSTQTTVASPQSVPSPPANNGPLDGTWIVLGAMAAGWVNAGGGWETAAYMRKDGIVYLRGVLINGTNGQAPFFLPAGYRPAANKAFPYTAMGPGRTQVRTDGAVYIDNGTGNTGWFLSGISFPAEA